MPLSSLAIKKRMNFFYVKKSIIRISLLIAFFFFFVLQINTQIVSGLPMENYQNKFVTEELRLKVPLNYKETWLKAEKEIWDPWLSSKKGFLGRQLFWDREKEEALILVNWKSKKLWKNIPMGEVNLIQKEFEDNVKTALNLRENPFELIYEGELDKQE